jgi:hypothetical protein
MAGVVRRHAQPCATSMRWSGLSLRASVTTNTVSVSFAKRKIEVKGHGICELTSEAVM